VWGEGNGLAFLPELLLNFIVVTCKDTSSSGIRGEDLLCGDQMK